MKKFLLMGLALAICSPVMSQYYYMKRSLGQNPGGLNTSQELPWGQGLDPQWTVIYNGGLAAASWTTVRPLPFPFEFNGSVVSTYRVSNSGVLTFNAGATDAPGFDNKALPSAEIPNNSICVWGLKGDYVDDKIVVRTFGSAPFRQFWIQFNNFNYGGGNPACNLYWSIVLEETSNSFYLVDQKNFITCLPTLTVGVQIDANTAIQVAGSPNISSLATNDPLPVDNSYYEFVPGVQPKYDLSAVKMLNPSYLQLSKTPLVISGKFESLGANVPAALDVSYQINGGPVVMGHITNTSNLAVLAHPKPWKPTTTGSYNLKMWVSNPDGVADNRTVNDTAYSQIDVVNDLPSRMALLEHATQHNCGPCAAYNPALEALLTNNNERPSTAVIKYHTWWPGANNDPMYLFNTADNASRVNYYNINGVPTAVVAGNIFSGSPSSVTTGQLDQARANDGLYNINITESVNATGDSLTVSVTAVPEVFIGSNNLKLRVAIVQDMLRFPSSSGTNGEKDFPDIMRYYVPNGTGMNLVPIIGVPTSVTAKKLLPASFKNSVIRVVAYVQDDATKDIYMATKSTGHFLCPNGGVLTGAVAIEDASCTTNNGQVSVTMTGGSGNYTYTWNVGGSTTSTATNLAPGSYTVTVSDGAGCEMPVYAVVKRKQAPTVALDVTPISCVGQSDGAVKAIVGGGTGTLTYAWNTGGTSDEVTGLGGGPVLVTVTDEVGCTTTVNTSLIAPSALTLTTTTTPDNGTLNGTATANVTGGTAYYYYEWNTNPVQTTKTATGLASGSYSVTVRDYNQCLIDEIDVVVNSNVGIEEELAMGIREFRLSPNPTQALTYLDISLDKPVELTMEIQDLHGRTLSREVLSRSSEHHRLVDLSSLSAGVYLMRLNIGEGVVYRKVVKE